jgi:hypothetical protein
MNTHKINKQEAITLRQMGYSYAEIAVHIGCSAAWCAKELKGVEKGTRINPSDAKAVKAGTIRILEQAIQAVRRI